MDPQLVDLFQGIRMGLAIGAVVVGLALCFLGNRLFDWILKMRGWIPGALIAGGLVYLVSREPFAALIAAPIGGVIGARAAHATYYGLIFASGALFGAAIAVAVYVLSQGHVDPAILLLLPILGGVLTLFFQKLLFIVATAFGGGGLVVAGAAGLALGAADPTSGGHLIAALLVGWLLLAIAGVKYQYAEIPESVGEDRPWRSRSDRTGRGSRKRNGPHAEFAPLQPSVRRAQALIGHSGAIKCMAWDPGERWLATGGEQGEIFVWCAETGRPLLRMQANRSTITALAVSPDGRSIAATSEGDPDIRIWNRADGTPRCRLVGHRAPVESLLPDADGRWLASAGGDMLLVWDWNSGDCLETIRNPRGFSQIIAIPSKEWFTFVDGYRVRVIDILGRSAHLTCSFWTMSKRALRRAPPVRITVSSDGRWLAWTDQEEVDPNEFLLYVLDLDCPDRPRPLRAGAESGSHNTYLRTGFHPNGRWLAVSGQWFLRRYAIPDGKLLDERTTELYSSSLRLCIDPAGRWIAAGAFGGNLLFIDLSPHAAPTEIALPGLDRFGGVSAASPSGCALAAADMDRRVVFWDTRTRRLRFRSNIDERRIRALAMAPHGNWLVSGGPESILRLWDAKTGWQRQALDEQRTCGAEVNQLAVAPNGLWVAAARRTYGTLLWDVRDDQSLSDCAPLKFYGHTLAFLPSVPLLALAGCVSGASLWELPGVERVRDFPLSSRMHSKPNIETLTCDRDGRWLAIGGTYDPLGGDEYYGALWLWYLDNNECRCLIHNIRSVQLDLDGTDRLSFPAPRKWRNLGPVFALTASPNGRWLASAGKQGGIWLWDPSRGRDADLLLRVLKDSSHRDPIFALAAAPDGTWLASAGEDGAIRYWDTETGRLRFPSEVGQGPIRSLAIHPEGRWLFSAGDDGLIRRWVLPPGLATEPKCDLAMQILPNGDWVTWKNPDQEYGRYWEPNGYSEGAKRWIGYHTPCPGGWEHQPLDSD